ncbi:MAG: SBBP repeat-containing protein [Bacteroidetes bacterium]|nr:SBBP repeat-containing protein [Bacteroidota bacterium]
MAVPRIHLQRNAVWLAAHCLLLLNAVCWQQAGAQPGESLCARNGGTRFVENRGQIRDADHHARPDILYIAESPGTRVYLRAAGLSYVFSRVEGQSASPPALGSRVLGSPVLGSRLGTAPPPDTGLRLTVYRMDMDLVGANQNARIESAGATECFANYYLSHTPQGITNVRAYDRVTYRDIYPHIDLVYHGTRNGMKYDFVVHPGGRVSDIAIRYTGARTLRQTEAGSVTVESPLGRVEEGTPEVYQTRSDTRRPVRGTYAAAGTTIRFNVGAYDAARDLVIDPALLWSTFVGGGNSELGANFFNTGNVWGPGSGRVGGNGCAADRDTTITFVGTTFSLDFPVTPGVAQTTYAGGATDFDCYVVRMSHHGARMWATYFGGSNQDIAGGVAVDAQHNAYFTAGTRSADFPTTPGAFQSPGGAGTSGAAIVKLDSLGRLVWSTCYAGASLPGIAVDGAGNVYVAGSASSTVTATPAAFRTNPPAAGQFAGLITKFNSTGTARIWSTFFATAAVTGPSFLRFEVLGATSLALDRSGNLCLCGTTGAADLPVTGGAFQTTSRGATDAWVAEFDSAGRRQWCTYYGGGSDDHASGIAVDAHRNVVVIGTTQSANLPVTAGAFQTAIAGTGTDCWIARFDSNGTNRWGTYYGGTNYDYGAGVAIDAAGRIWCSAYSISPDFPVSGDAYQAAMRGNVDAAVVKLDSNGNRQWATLLGSPGWDYPEGIAVNTFGCIVTGETSDNGFPTSANAFQRTLSGGSDGFATAFCDAAVTVSANGPLAFCAGDSVTLRVPSGFDSYRWTNGSVSSSIVVKQSGTYGVTVTIGNCTFVSDQVQVVAHSVPQHRVVPHLIQLCDGDSSTITVLGQLTAYHWSTGDTTAAITVRKAGHYSLTYLDSNGCAGHGDTAIVTVVPRPTATIVTTQPLTFCDGGSTLLDAGSGYAQYVWSNGATTPSIAATKSGTYTVRVLSTSGCWSDESAPVRVNALPNPVVTLRNILPTTFCNGDSTILVAASGTGATFSWSDGSTTPVITVRKSGKYTVIVTDTNGCSTNASMSITVIERPQLTVRAHGPTRFCDGDSVELSASGSGQFQWSNGFSDSTIVVKAPGKYFVIGTNVSGCLGTSDTITVEVVPLRSAAIAGPVRVCSSALASYSVTNAAGARYDWDVTGSGAINTGAGTSTISVLWGATGGGIVHVRVTDDSTGCSHDTSLNVVIGASLVPVVTSSRSLNLCPGDSVTLDAGVFAGYHWSNGATDRSITVSVAGDYTVTAVDSKGCSGTSDPVHVRTATPPTPVIALPDGPLFCEGDSLVLDAGAGYAKYQWSNGFTSQRVAVRSGGVYSVVVTDANGCTGAAPPVTITMERSPVPEVHGPRIVCHGSHIGYITADSAGARYAWQVNGGVIANGQGSSSIVVDWGPIGVGTVAVTATSARACSATSQTYEVNIGDKLEPAVTPSGSLSLCPGGKITLDAGAGYVSYLWNTGATTQTIDVTVPGQYAVTVADAGGCSGTSASVDVVAKIAPMPAVEPPGPIELCDGDSVELNAGAGYAGYLWSSGQRTQKIVVKSGGAYSVTVTSVEGCQGTSSIVPVRIHARPARPAVTLNGGILASTPASTYQWSLNGASIAGATAPQYVPAASGLYRVTIGDANGCTATSDPFPYSIRSRLVWLDTVSARVGDRISMAMHVQPGLLVDDGIHGYHAELSYDPKAIFIHDVVSPDRSVAGDAASFSVTSLGRLTVDRSVSSPAITGGELFRIELEGLVSGQPLDPMRVEKVEVPEASGLAIAGNGLLILSGCQIGMGFGKLARLDVVRPNPATGGITIRYRLPAGAAATLHVFDGVGHELEGTALPPGTGDFEERYVSLGDLSSGVYLLELHQGAERCALPLVVAR